MAGLLPGSYSSADYREIYANFNNNNNNNNRHFTDVTKTRAVT